MKGIFKAAVLAIVPLVAACSFDIDGARNMPNSGTAFHQGLQANYALLAQMEYNEQDWIDAKFFEERAVMAANGENFGPQDSAERDLPADMVDKAGFTRIQLVSALDAGGREIAPSHASRAQAMYDCWLQELEENIQPDDIKWCWDNFDTAMKSMKAAMMPAPVAAPAPAPAPMPMPMAMPGPFVVYFPFDSAALDAASLDVIQNAAVQFKNAGAANIVLEGHTDLAGDADYNIGLSQKRALAVADALRQAGVSDSMINVTAFGETMPAIKTDDGVKEPQNRRAVIQLSK